MIAKTLTLRLPEDNGFHKNLEWCSVKLNEKTASKTFISAVNSLPILIEKYEKSENRVIELERENERLKQIIKNAQISSKAFNEALSQEDLF